MLTSFLMKLKGWEKICEFNERQYSGNVNFQIFVVDLVGLYMWVWHGKVIHVALNELTLCFESLHRCV